MQKWKKSIFVVCLVGFGLLVGSGCPFFPKPNYLPFFIVNPESLDFGTTQNTLPLQVSKSYTSQDLSSFTVASDGFPWITVTPSSGTSSGPDAPATFSVLVNRSLLPAGTSTGSILVSAPGVTPKSVPVSVTARIAADFSASTEIAVINSAIDFTDLSAVASGEAPISSWFWNFGDGQTSTLQNVSHFYTTPGKYTVSLHVSNGVLSDTEEKLGYITVQGPTTPSADFGVSNQTPFVNEQVQFSDQSYPGTSPITNWLWDFGDATTSTAQNPTHTYTSTGQFTVSLTVTTAIGSDTKTVTNYMTVLGIGPTANFIAATTTPYVNIPVQFTDQSLAGSSPITNWLWNFGDTTTSTAQNPTHTYTTVGTFTVSLQVTTLVGSNTKVRTNYLTTSNKPPTADFSADDTTPGVSQVVNFSDQSDPGSSPITNWFWRFGDGGTSTLQNPTHAYTAIAAYSVYLQVQTLVGTDSVTKTNYINVHAKKLLQEMGSGK